MKKELMLMVLMFGILVGVGALISAQEITGDAVISGNVEKYESTGNKCAGCPGPNCPAGCSQANLEVAKVGNPCSGDSDCEIGEACSGGKCVELGAPTGGKTTSKRSSQTSSAKKSSGVPKGWEGVPAADGTICYVKSQNSGRATGRFLGFMFRD